MPEHTLVGESFGPFTQKARWALEYGGVEHAYQEHTPTPQRAQAALAHAPVDGGCLGAIEEKR